MLKIDGARTTSEPRVRYMCPFSTAYSNSYHSGLKTTDEECDVSREGPIMYECQIIFITLNPQEAVPPDNITKYVRALGFFKYEIQVHATHVSRF